MRRLPIAALVSTAVMAAWSASALGDTPPRNAEIVVTRMNATMTPGCGPAEVAGIARDFTDAFNSGDASALDRLLAAPRTLPLGYYPETGEIGFQWYATNEPDAKVTLYERAEVVPHLLGRFELGERMRVRSVAAAPAIDGRGGATLTLDRSASDLRLPATRHGKVVVNCASRTIFQLVLGYYAEPLGSLCPRAAADAIAACSTGPNAHAVGPDFRVGRTPGRLPPGCAPSGVRDRVTAMLAAVNRGDGKLFTSEFAKDSLFRSGGTTIARRDRARFVSGRFRDGTGWTALQLQPPRKASRRSAAFALRLRVTNGGSVVGDRKVAIVIDCSSGLIRRWVGPS